jgi:ribonuclease HI
LYDKRKVNDCVVQYMNTTQPLLSDPAPHYLLSSEASRTNGSGHWRFELRAADDSARSEAADVEPDVWGERLDLLTVVRALESLDQPSRVTVVACSRYVEQGLQYGLSEWRENGWRWEAFGQLVPVRDADLWQRLDRILQFHSVDCGQRRSDGGHASLAGPHWGMQRKMEASDGRVAGSDWVKCIAPALVLLGGPWMTVASRFWQLISHFGCLFLLHRS